MNPGGEIIDRFNLGKLPVGYSYGRKDGQLLYFNEPTPAAENKKGYAGLAAQPNILTTSGLYNAPVQVAVEVPQGVAAYYTTDGSEPNQESPRYTGPVMLSKMAGEEMPEGNVFRVRGYSDGMLPSAVSTGNYFIDSRHTLPIVALSTAPANMYDPKIGIYVRGDGERANYAQEWERPVNFQLFDTDGRLLIDTDACFRVFGAYSRAEREQKGLAVIARGEYGDNRLRFPLFESRPYEEYKSVVLRASGMDSTVTKVRDMLATSIAGDGGILAVQAYKQCVLYINGEYFGVYNLREKVTKYFLEQHYGVNPENLDFLVGSGTSSGSVLQGDTKEYKALLAYLESHALSDAENYAYIEERIDVDNFIDWLFAEMYFMNTDTGNIKYFRERREGSKWRWIFYDLDWGFAGSSRNPFEYWLDPQGHGGSSKMFSTLLERKMFESPVFREKFLERAAYLLKNVYTSEKVLARMDELVGNIESEMQRDAKRWPQGNGFNVWQSNVKSTRTFCEKRTDYMIYHVRKQFGVSESEAQNLFGSLGMAP